MKTASKRTIITSKATGRRYYLHRPSNRSSARRYYVCSKLDCDSRVVREADIFCRAHSQAKSSGDENIADISTQSDYVDEDVLNDHSEVVQEEETPTKARESTKSDSNDDNQHENGNNGSITEDDFNDTSNNVKTSLKVSMKKKPKAKRQIDVNESTGKRSFRDNSGRRRFLCMELSCESLLKCQNDSYCRIHLHNNVNENEVKKNRGNHQRNSAPPISKRTKTQLPSPLAPTPSEPEIGNGTNGNHSEEYESPQKTPERTGIPRSFRDAAGKIRFLCANPSCNSRLVRQAEIFCKRHQLEIQGTQGENNMQSVTTNDSINHKDEENNVQEMDVNHNNTDIPPEPSIKKRTNESQPIISQSNNISSIPANKIVISSTTLLEDQWGNILTFLRQFPQIQLATNFNVNNSTTHLLVDDSEKHLHCTITKKIVQAAVRRHVFIISSRWINECIHSNEFLDEHPYEIQSDSHTTLRFSIQNLEINNKYLFNNSSLKYIYGFAIECRQCQGSINRNELIELVELTGAKVYDNDINIDILIVLCDTNEKNLNKIKEKYLQTNISNIKYVTSDFLLKSIIKFEIQDVDKYLL